MNLSFRKCCLTLLIVESVNNLFSLLFSITWFNQLTNMFNPATLFMYVPFPSQEPVIQWLSFGYVLHIFFSFIFLLYYKAVIFSFELFYIVLSGPFIADYAVWALLIVEGSLVTYMYSC